MTAEQIAKIELAVVDFLNAGRGAVQPFTRLSQHTEALKADPSWTAEEVNEFELRVVRTLMNGSPGAGCGA
jgi:hypothetical protein